VYSEEVKRRNGFIRPYNLNNLKEVDYRVVVEDENGTSEKTISNAREQAVVLASVVNIRKNQGKCLVTLFTKGEADVTVKVLDADRNEIASESYRISGQSTKLFNLADVKGALFVEVSDSGGLVKSALIE
jgi:prolyl oligopeptidase PreP (S9A serine peptidase family)